MKPITPEAFGRVCILVAMAIDGKCPDAAMRRIAAENHPDVDHEDLRLAIDGAVDLWKRVTGTELTSAELALLDEEIEAVREFDDIAFVRLEDSRMEHAP